MVNYPGHLEDIRIMKYGTLFFLSGNLQLHPN